MSDHDPGNSVKAVLKPKFDGTIQLGHVIQFLGVMIGGLVAVIAIYYGMMQTNYVQDARIDALNARILNEVNRIEQRIQNNEARFDKRIADIEKAFDRSQSDEKEQLNAIRSSQERIQSSVGQINVEVARFIGGQNAIRK